METWRHTARSQLERVESLISYRFPIAKAADALEAVKSGTAIKAMIDPEPS
jgi:hypothetical protein